VTVSFSNNILHRGVCKYPLGVFFSVDSDRMLCAAVAPKRQTSECAVGEFHWLHGHLNLRCVLERLILMVTQNLLLCVA
jgi:hypothetical protein